jgi:ABC-2 type transport system ATP-binding protein
MPDFFGVYDSLKCWEYLDFYARCYRIGADERKRMTRRLLELVQLEEKENEYVDALSRGMKQRLCLARSLIHDPKLLILDEPASGMDPRARAEMKGILRTLREMGKTVLISSHILPELAEMCDSLTILDHGQLVFSGSVEALSDKMNGNAPLDIRLAEGCGVEAVETAVRCLKEMPAVTEILQEEPFLLRVRLENGEDICPAVLRQLVMKGVPVCDFHRAPMNLEKVFMEVTQDA